MGLGVGAERLGKGRAEGGSDGALRQKPRHAGHEPFPDGGLLDQPGVRPQPAVREAGEPKPGVCLRQGPAHRARSRVRAAALAGGGGRGGGDRAGALHLVVATDWATLPLYPSRWLALSDIISLPISHRLTQR